MTTTCERSPFRRLDAPMPSELECAELRQRVRELEAAAVARDGVVRELSDTLKRRQSDSDSLNQRIGQLEQRLRANGISDQ